MKLITKFNDNNFSQQVLTGSLANFSLKLNENNNISFKNIFSINWPGTNSGCLH
jgi:hypothetical protein